MAGGAIDVSRTAVPARKAAKATAATDCIVMILNIAPPTQEIVPGMISASRAVSSVLFGSDMKILRWPMIKAAYRAIKTPRKKIKA